MRRLVWAPGGIALQHDELAVGRIAVRDHHPTAVHHRQRRRSPDIAHPGGRHDLDLTGTRRFDTAGDDQIAAHGVVHRHDRPVIAVDAERHLAVAGHPWEFTQSTRLLDHITSDDRRPQPFLEPHRDDEITVVAPRCVEQGLAGRRVPAFP